MEIKPNSKLHSDADVAMALLEKALAAQEQRADLVRDALKATSKLEERLQLPLAKLLMEAGDLRYWELWGFESFEAFVHQDCEFSLRKAQELVKIYRKLSVELEIPDTQISGLPWTKLALVAGKITKANVAAVIEDVKKNTYSELKQIYGGKKSGKKLRPESVRTFKLTKIIVDALLRAAQATGRDDLQVNLEHVAAHFLCLGMSFTRLVEPSEN
jgi:hypothetical protein